VVGRKSNVEEVVEGLLLLVSKPSKGIQNLKKER
jgi:hypothetical protein